MCGIFCCIASEISPGHNCLDNRLAELLQKRGPNSNQIIRVNNVQLAGFVLWQQGHTICTQPVESDKHIFVYNGDVFNTQDHICSDTEWMFEKFSHAADEYELMDIIRRVEGPFSFVFYDKHKQCIYFARDSLGRNSLLLEKNKSHMRILSISHMYDENTKTIELPPLGVYKACLQNLSNFQVFPWQNPDEYWKEQAKYVENAFNIKIVTENALAPVWLKTHNNLYQFHFSFYDFKINKNISSKQLFENFLKNDQISLAIDAFSYFLERSVKKRVEATTNFCKICMQSSISCDHSKIAILFSGGIDCSILAVLADKYVPTCDSIDLINVAFEAAHLKEINWDVPDRLTAKSTLHNLNTICPSRKWNFIEVNVTREKLNFQLEQHIKHLIYPLNTVLDESIGCAFWFASDANADASERKYSSTARVVLVGSGADELFGGYMRHRNAYNRCPGTQVDKDECVNTELETDWKRLPTRNLARDDRVMSDSGKTPRAPFVEENVVRFVHSMRSNQRCCFLYGDGIGDKLFLRLYGYRLGLTNPAFLKKKAIQFGSKIANKKQNARDISALLSTCQ